MALDTGRNIAMTICMTHDTANLTMLGVSLAKNIISLYMTRTTISRNNTGAIRNSKWLMGTVAFDTTIRLHGIRMGLMAVTTWLQLPMEIMAGRTGKLSMNTGICLQLLKLTHVTGKTRYGYIMGQLNRKRSVGIFMTFKTIYQLKVRLTDMTGTT